MREYTSGSDESAIAELEEIVLDDGQIDVTALRRENQQLKKLPTAVPLGPDVEKTIIQEKMELTRRMYYAVQSPAKHGEASIASSLIERITSGSGRDPDMCMVWVDESWFELPQEQQRVAIRRMLEIYLQMYKVEHRYDKARFPDLDLGAPSEIVAVRIGIESLQRPDVARGFTDGKEFRIVVDDK